MTEYICKEVPTENGGYLEIEAELIRCKECRWFINKECAIYCLSSAHEETFCSYAEPKDTTEEVRKQLKDMEQRREMDRKK